MIERKFHFTEHTRYLIENMLRDKFKGIEGLSVTMDKEHKEIIVQYEDQRFSQSEIETFIANLPTWVK